MRWHTRAADDPAGRAHARLDYLHNSGTITIPAGQTTAFGAVLLQQDDLPEGDEQFAVQLTHPQGATLARPVATMTITDDD